MHRPPTWEDFRPPGGPPQPWPPRPTASRPDDEPWMKLKEEQEKDEGGMPLLVFMVILAVCLGLSGARLAWRNDYSHISRKTADDYSQAVLTWETEVLPLLSSASITVFLNASMPVPLNYSSKATRRVLIRNLSTVSCHGQVPGQQPRPERFQTERARLYLTSEHGWFEALRLLCHYFPPEQRPETPLGLTDLMGFDNNVSVNVDRLPDPDLNSYSDYHLNQSEPVPDSSSHLSTDQLTHGKGEASAGEVSPNDDRSADSSADSSRDSSADSSSDSSADRTSDSSADSSRYSSADSSRDSSADSSADSSRDRSADSSADRTSDSSADSSRYSSADSSRGSSADSSRDRSADRTPDSSADSSADSSLRDLAEDSSPDTGGIATVVHTWVGTDQLPRPRSPGRGKRSARSRTGTTYPGQGEESTTSTSSTTSTNPSQGDKSTTSTSSATSTNPDRGDESTTSTSSTTSTNRGRGPREVHPIERARRREPERQLSLDMLYSSQLSLEIAVPAVREGEATTQVSRINLGARPFVRASVAPSRNPRECNRRLLGSFDYNQGTCTVVEYLAELCFTLQDDLDREPGHYILDDSRGDVGCKLNQQYAPEMWRTVMLPFDSATMMKSGTTMVLPKVLKAALATKLILRHVKDPELEEHHLKIQMSSERDPLIASYALGIVFIVISLTSLFALLTVALPSLKSRRRKAKLKRSKHAAQKVQFEI